MLSLSNLADATAAAVELTEKNRAKEKQAQFFRKVIEIIVNISEKLKIQAETPKASREYAVFEILNNEEEKFYFNCKAMFLNKVRSTYGNECSIYIGPQEKKYKSNYGSGVRSVDTYILQYFCITWDGHKHEDVLRKDHLYMEDNFVSSLDKSQIRITLGKNISN